MANIIRNKSDVQTHSDSYYGPQYPALNVKVYNFNRAAIEKHFADVEESDLDRALEFAWESAQQLFCEDAPELAKAIFGNHVKVWSAGRSSGWLIVEGLSDISSWDAVMLSKWHKFAKTIDAEIKYKTSPESIIEDIEANEWIKPGSEKYNFYKFQDGHTETIADMKQKAREAGFGLVVRR